MVHVDTKTSYMKLLETHLAKKHKLAADAWGADEQYVKPYYEKLTELITTDVAPKEEDRRLYPWPVWNLQARIGRLSRNILVSEFLVKEWAEHFRGKSKAELDDIAASFKFENCLKREGLNKVLQDNASLVAQSS